MNENYVCCMHARCTIIIRRWMMMMMMNETNYFIYILWIRMKIFNCLIFLNDGKLDWLIDEASSFLFLHSHTNGSLLHSWMIIVVGINFIFYFPCLNRSRNDSFDSIHSFLDDWNKAHWTYTHMKKNHSYVIGLGWLDSYMIIYIRWNVWLYV